MFFVQTKHSYCFKKVHIALKRWKFNHWRHMDYFNDVFTTFLGLYSGSCVAVNGETKSSQIQL